MFERKTKFLTFFLTGFLRYWASQPGTSGNNISCFQNVLLKFNFDQNLLNWKISFHFKFVFWLCESDRLLL